MWLRRTCAVNIPNASGGDRSESQAETRVKHWVDESRHQISTPLLRKFVCFAMGIMNTRTFENYISPASSLSYDLLWNVGSVCIAHIRCYQAEKYAH
jgi:hypothetical protein